MLNFPFRINSLSITSLVVGSLINLLNVFSRCQIPLDSTGFSMEEIFGIIQSTSCFVVKDMRLSYKHRLKDEVE